MNGLCTEESPLVPRSRAISKHAIIHDSNFINFEASGAGAIARIQAKFQPANVTINRNCRTKSLYRNMLVRPLIKFPNAACTAAGRIFITNKCSNKTGIG